MIIDLRQLTFIHSVGLNVIAEAHARARRSNRRLVFVRGPAQIDRLFELVGLAERLEIIDLKPVLALAAPATRPHAGAGDHQHANAARSQLQLRARPPGLVTLPLQSPALQVRSVAPASRGRALP